MSINQALDMNLIKELVDKIVTIKDYSVKLALLRTAVKEDSANDGVSAEEAFEGIMSTLNYDEYLFLAFSKPMLSSYTYLVGVQRLEDLSARMSEYIETFETNLKDFFENVSPEELGSNKFWNEQPLYDAKPFVDEMAKLLPPREMEYFVDVYDLNDELSIFTKTAEEAKELAFMLAPAVAYRYTNDNSITKTHKVAHEIASY